MPELPDLTLFAENMHRRFGNRAVESAEYHKAKRLNVTPEELHTALAGKTLQAVRRDGKGLVLDFGDAHIDVHLMLKGELAGAARDRADAVPYRVMSLHFADGGESFFVCDAMALTTVSLSNIAYSADSTVPDALEMTTEHLAKHAKRTARTPIKGLLIDQNVVRGIGNAYADEILYVARISPKSLSGSIPAEGITRIAEATREVLEDAIVQLRTLRPDATGGEYRDFLRLHNPTRTHTESGYPILKEEVAKKNTSYTEEQEFFG